MMGYKHVTPKREKHFEKLLGLRKSEPALSDSETKVDYIAVQQKYHKDMIKRRQQELAEIAFKGCSDDMIQVRYDAENMQKATDAFGLPRWVSSRPSRIRYPTAKEALERIRQKRAGQLELF
jgi:hypothetical protein